MAVVIRTGVLPADRRIVIPARLPGEWAVLDDGSCWHPNVATPTVREPILYDALVEAMDPRGEGDLAILVIEDRTRVAGTGMRVRATPQVPTATKLQALSLAMLRLLDELADTRDEALRQTIWRGWHQARDLTYPERPR